MVLPGSSPIAIEHHDPGVHRSDGTIIGAQCRWPIGYPVRYCGLSTEGHRDYCPAHQRLAFKAVLPPIGMKKKK